MVPLSGTRLSGILEVFDVNVWYCPIRHLWPLYPSIPISVTSDDITFFRDRISKIRARLDLRNKLSYKYNSISGLYSIRRSMWAWSVRPKRNAHRITRPDPLKKTVKCTPLLPLVLIGSVTIWLKIKKKRDSSEKCFGWRTVDFHMVIFQSTSLETDTKQSLGENGLDRMCILLWKSS